MDWLIQLLKHKPAGRTVVLSVLLAAWLPLLVEPPCGLLARPAAPSQLLAGLSCREWPLPRVLPIRTPVLPICTPVKMCHKSASELPVVITSHQPLQEPMPLQPRRGPLLLHTEDWITASQEVTASVSVSWPTNEARRTLRTVPTVSRVGREV